jgi:hypothetical protein
LFLKSGFSFLDGGEVEHVTLIDGGSGDCRVRIYDTEDPTMLPLGALRENLATLTANATEPSRGLGFRCKRGCYVELSGTHPQAILRVGKIASDRAERV